jgi:hypothetical protein
MGKKTGECGCYLWKGENYINILWDAGNEWRRILFTETLDMKCHLLVILLSSKQLTIKVYDFSRNLAQSDFLSLCNDAQTLSSSYPRTSIAVSDKHRQMHSHIIKSPLY